MKILYRVVGAIGTLACVVLFILSPSFPTPDKLLFFLIFVFMIFGQAWLMFKRFAPFVAILLAYDSFRSLAPSLNAHVHYTLMPNFDKGVFGTLPVITLQKWLWHGHVQWYDFMFYGVYMMHFIMPIILALIVWKLRESHYWEVVMAYIIASTAGFITFLLYPTAPPWMASQAGIIPPITRISSQVYAAMGITNFPSIYNRLSPNNVAAVPSLHAAFATIFSLYIFKLFGKKWGALSLIYPILIIFGVVYMGEHYVFDVVTGVVLAVISYLFAPYLLKQVRRLLRYVLFWFNLPKLAKKIPKTA